MKLLVDACAGQRLSGQLRLASHDVLFVGDWDNDPGDEEILAIAQSEQRVIITRDKDLVRWPSGTSCLVVELSAWWNCPPSLEFDLCARVLARHEAELARGGLITVEAHRIRVREPL